MILLFLACIDPSEVKGEGAPGPDTGSGDSAGADSAPGSAPDACDVSAGLDINDYVTASTVDGWPLVINELYAAPKYTDTSAPEESAGVDWIEIYNRSSEDVSLQDVTVLSNVGTEGGSDDLSRFGTLGAGAWLALLATGEATDTTIAVRLDDSGEVIMLRDASGVVMERVDFPEIADACTLSRVPDGGDQWAITSPTQGASNG